MGGQSSVNKEQEQDSKTKRKKPTSIPDFDRTVLDLKNARDKLRRFRKKLDEDCVRLKDKAAVYLDNNQKERAISLLKLRKYKTKEADNVESQLFNLMNMINTVEFEVQNVEVLQAMQKGTEALNKMHENISLETVERILDESREAIELENQIANMISAEFTKNDDDEIEEEYERIKKSLELEKTLELPNPTAAGSVSTSNISTNLPLPPSTKIDIHTQSAEHDAMASNNNNEEEKEAILF